MKKSLRIFFITLLLIGCTKNYIQIFETQSTNTKKIDDFFVFENDSVKITYSFWGNKGLLSFAVYNKLEKPIYIDWKNSSFIYNSNKLDYWIEETQKSTVGYFGSYLYSGPLIKPGYTLQSGGQVSSSNEVKPERITFIPPKSNYFKSQFYLLPITCYKLNSDSAETTIVSRRDNQKKNTTIFSEDFSILNSPLIFRNFIAFSFAEDSREYFFVDNEFYLNNVKEMDLRHYWGKSTGVDTKGSSIYGKSTFKQGTSFFIDVPENCENISKTKRK